MTKNQKPNNAKAKFKVWMGKDGIMRTVLIGVLDEETAKEFVKEELRVVEAAPGKVNSISFIGKAGKGSPVARKLLIEIMRHERIGKIALIGASPLIRVMADVMLKIVGVKNAKHFKTEEEAVKWIKEEK